jgi:serine/threonine protein kinase
MRLEPGSRLGEYRLVARLRHDAWSENWRAREDRSGATFELRVFLAATPGARAGLDRIPPRVRSAAGLRHPNIRTVHAIGEEAGIDFLVLENLRGETLAERLGRSSMTSEVALGLAGEIAAALDTAHRAGLSHGNLDPEKIFLSHAGVKVLDFGFERAVRSLVPAAPANPTAAEVRTTPIPAGLAYVSPEEILGQDADVRSDLFSFGAILHEMITGERAFDGDARAKVVVAILQETPRVIEESRSSLHPAVQRILARCLAKDPCERFACAREMRAELERITGDRLRDEASARMLATSHSRRELVAWTIAGVIAIATLADGLSGSDTSDVGTGVPSSSKDSTSKFASSSSKDDRTGVPDRGTEPTGGPAGGAGD